MSLLLWGKLRTTKRKTVFHRDGVYFQLRVLVFETFKGWISWASISFLAVLLNFNKVHFIFPICLTAETFLLIAVSEHWPAY